MMKVLLNLLAVLLVLGAGRPAWGQRENSNWYFGNNAALNFPAGGGAPVPVAGSAITSYEACASVSNAAGQLQFYSDSETIWNRNNQVMPNGTNVGGWLSAAQGATIVQNPANAQQYYMFVLDGAAAQGGLKYTLVDMAQQGGLGAVTARAVQVAPGALTEKLTSVPHANGRDTWVLVHGWQTNIFYAYLVTPSGVQTTPVTTAIGSVHGGGGYGNSVGYMRASPDGTRLALAIRDENYEVFDFNPATGQLSNFIQLGDIGRCYGVAFSPNGRLLYTTNINYHQVYQFDLQAGSAAAVAASGQLVATTTTDTSSLQLGPDGKLYVSVYTSPYLAVINNPNVRGTGCGFQANGVYLNGAICQNGLPNNPGSLASPVAVTATIAYVPACQGLATAFTGTVTPAPAGAVATWNFGDPASGAANTATGLTTTHTYAQAGTYQAALTVTAPGLSTPLSATQTVTVAPRPAPTLGADTAACGPVVQRVRGTVPAGSTFRWQDGSTNASYTAAASGTYTVQVTSPAGCVATASRQITLNAPPAPRLPADTAACGSPVVLRVRGAVPAGSTFRWQDGSTNATYTAAASGTYTVQVTSPAGCVGQAATRLVVNPRPVVSLGPDTVACGGPVVLRARGSWPTGSTFRWQDGSTAATYPATASGSYSVQVTSPAGCVGQAARQLTLAPVPTASLGADTAVCGSSVLLRVRGSWPAGSTFRWSDGSSAATLLAAASGTYSVRVTSPAGCLATATRRVTLNVVPVLRMPTDTAACGGPVLLRARGSWPTGSTFRWQDGSTAATYPATVSGSYTVQVTSPPGCVGQGQSTTRVLIDPLPVVRLPADTLVCQGSPFVVRPRGSWPTGSTFRWQDGSTAATYPAPGPGTYSVEVRTPAGCRTTATLVATSQDCPTLIPNLIIPNGDQLNDQFVLRGLVAADWQLTVFSRWGRPVYEQARYDNRWNAAGQPAGLYYYLLRHNTTGQVVKGWVEVYRAN